ncbi:MAG: recombinase family protein [Cyanobacterium sp. T60_A2020_053]|nr:recombinase family protein [Cyanobacterium sp. T60_A2020_053]
MAKKKQKPIWIEGNSCAGKTTRLVDYLAKLTTKKTNFHNLQKPLIFSPNQEDKDVLEKAIFSKTQNLFPAIEIYTPSAFILQEVELFFPLILEQLKVKPFFPFRLSTPLERELSAPFAQAQFTPEILNLWGGESRAISHILDLLPLAGMARMPIQNIKNYLEKSQLLDPFDKENNEKMVKIVDNILSQWWHWCLERGFLTYGITYQLYGQYLLSNLTYQDSLINRYHSIFADNLDNFPALLGDLFKLFIDKNIYSVFTYNYQGKVRLGLNADPDYLLSIRDACQVETLASFASDNLAVNLADDFYNIVINQEFNPIDFQEKVYSIKTKTRAQLIEDTANFIINQVKNNHIKPEEIAIIAPGLDEIARFQFLYFLHQANIPIEPLKEQRPLIVSPLVRSVLNLLGLIYRGCGRLIEREGVAEMLTLLSQKEGGRWGIDPVRAGLLAEYCYLVDIESPQLLPIEYLSKGERMNYDSFMAYNEIRDWINDTKTAGLSPLAVIDLITERFFAEVRALDYADYASLKKLRETARAFFVVQQKLKEYDFPHKTDDDSMQDWIVFMRKGTVTTNPYPRDYFISRTKERGVILATIYQYRVANLSHRWQFWFDAGSKLWEKGGATELWGYQLFLRGCHGKPLITQDNPENVRLSGVIHDLLAHTTDKLFLCHSDLDVGGNEQGGALFPLTQILPTVAESLMLDRFMVQS